MCVLDDGFVDFILNLLRLGKKRIEKKGVDVNIWLFCEKLESIMIFVRRVIIVLWVFLYVFLCKIKVVGCRLIFRLEVVVFVCCFFV